MYRAFLQKFPRRFSWIMTFIAAAMVLAFGFVNCSGGGGGDGSGTDGAAGSGDWYYHWSCNGDIQCLQTNPNGTATGTNDEGPEEVNCTQLMVFAAHFWGTAATNSCDQSPTGSTGGGPAPTLTSITVSPSTATLPIGETQQYTATAHYSDGSTADITHNVTWIVGTGTVYIGTTPTATITNTGMLTAGAVGTTTVKATQGSLSGLANLTVTAAALQSIVVTPANPSLAIGLSQLMTATGHFSDGTTADMTAQVTWSSSNTTAASITSGGVAKALAIGTSTITATKGSISGNTLLTVTAVALQSIVVTPANPSVATTFSLQMKATGQFSDGSTQDLTATATWSSGTPAAVTIGSAGLVTGVAAGTSLITAAESGVSGSTAVTVTTATLVSISVSPANPFVAPGGQLQFAAIGNFSDGSTQVLAGVTWTSATTSVATISSAGLASAIIQGTSTITASYGGLQGSTLLSVSYTGITWAPQTSPTASQSLSGVVWAGSQFVAVGASGTILTSPDGITWTSQTSGTSNALVGVTWSGSQLVAVGASGTLLTSPDGITWTARSSSVTTNLAAVAWSGNLFAAVGDSGVILTSPDGVTWTSRSSGTSYSLYGAVWSGSQFVVVGYISAIYTSPDGVTWTSENGVNLSIFYGVASSGSGLVCVGGVSSQNLVTHVHSSAGVAFTSSTGSTWTSHSPGTGSYLYGIGWAGAQYVAVGAGGTLLVSSDGVAWTARTSGSSNTLRAVAWSTSLSRIVVVGDNGTILVSP